MSGTSPGSNRRIWRTRWAVPASPEVMRGQGTVFADVDSDPVAGYFGPTPPRVGESNWVPTLTNRSFEVLFRFYGPQPSLFDKTWRLCDIEEASA